MSLSIVFSSWKKTLDLVGQLLASRSISYMCIHGSIPYRERERILERFRSFESEKILLMTLGTGAEG